MTRPNIHALCIVLLPAMALADHDAAPKPAQIDQAVDVCIINTQHPDHHSEICRAFLYGSAYQKTLQNTGADGLGGQTFYSLPGQVQPWTPGDQLLDRIPGMWEQSVDPQAQNLPRLTPNWVIIPELPDGFGGDVGQIVR